MDQRTWYVSNFCGNLGKLSCALIREAVLKAYLNERREDLSSSSFSLTPFIIASAFSAHFCWPPLLLPHDVITPTTWDLMQLALTACLELYCGLWFHGNHPRASPSNNFAGKWWGNVIKQTVVYEKLLAPSGIVDCINHCVEQKGFVIMLQLQQGRKWERSWFFRLPVYCIFNIFVRQTYTFIPICY